MAAFNDRLAKCYPTLSEKLRQAGDYVVRNPVNVATRSLRQVSEHSNLSPATFTRMSKALGYESLDALRNELREKLGHRNTRFTNRTSKVQESDRSTVSFSEEHFGTCIANLSTLQHDLDYEELNSTVTRLRLAPRVFLMGALGSTGVIEYLAYMAAYAHGSWTILGRTGASVGAALADISGEDVFLLITKPPFSSRATRAAQLAADRGAFLIVITDTAACPVLESASASFIVPTESPLIYSSYVATTALAEILIGTMVGQSNEEAQSRMQSVEHSNRILEEVWDG